ncbi:MAG: hypothetical protein QT11_C0001G0352 [archaeon GW2011_AR20]|nr:MAG: hypothetical protein QT11_C0001G0352 [archaeon GW2011_AR20]AQS28028.1 hypothetical protein [uncultured archaeon]AQS28520.1 hypothetical protein [uncultured archaeon]AQS28630.1 hypothetical protein [uncultured archaeon]MBS3160360.1 TRAM domain-containing protein [Candidatus Woesearchaeota archaeon]
MYNKRRFGENRGGYGGGGRSFAPVNVGDEIELKIEAVGEKGDGIAKVKGFVIFVPGVKQGETVKVRITKVLRKVGFGEVAGTGSSKSEESAESSEMNQADQGSESFEEETQEVADETEDSEDFGDEE